MAADIVTAVAAAGTAAGLVAVAVVTAIVSIWAFKLIKRAL